MIVYFANRAMKILGLASTELPEGFHITDDTEAADVETGLLTLECTIHWTQESRSLAQECAAVGNYMLKQTTDFVKDYRLDYDAECYTIIEMEEDTKDRTTYIYAESGGMDLLNSVVGPYEATTAHTAAWYISMFTENSGFKVNQSHIEDLERKLEWTGEATVAERVASVGTQFDHAEIEYRVALRGLQLWEKLINIHKQRGEDNHVILRLNQEVDRIVTTTSIADLATALYVEGGIPEGEEDPVTLEGYSATADGGDIYTDGDGIVKSKSALAKWTRYANAQEPYQSGDGHIVKRWSYDTTSQSELFNRAVTQLQKIYTPAVNYEVYVTTIPDEIGIGDYVYIVDEEGELYVQSRVLGIETSAANNTAKLTLGDYRLASDGLSTQVDSLSSQLSSVRSQTVQTAATVDKLQSDVSSLKSSSVSSSSSVSVTLSNSYGSASGTLSFSNGMSLSLERLFNDYATQSWVTETALSGYATQSWVTNQGYLTSSALSGYATQQWVTGQGYLTSVPSGYATEDWVKNQGYLTSSSSVATAEKLKTARTFALTFNNSNLDSHSFDGSAGVSLAVDDLLNKDLTFTGTNTFSGRVYFRYGAYFSSYSPVLSENVSLNSYVNDSYGETMDLIKGGSSVIVGSSFFDTNIHGATIYMNGTAWSSDERLKTDIEPLTESGLDNLTPVTFKWQEGDDKRHYGYIAQDVREHIPELVGEADDGMLYVAYLEIIPLLHNKINELEERIEKLEDIINEHT